MAASHARWQLVFGVLLLLFLAGVGAGFYVMAHGDRPAPEGDDSSRERAGVTAW